MSELKPNILYLHSHDTGRYISPYGFAVPTPNLQHFAEAGTVLRQAFCANPTCSPSRAALLTGLWPHCNGMFGLAHRGWRLNDYGQHLVNTLRPAGYHTALCGVQHVCSHRVGTPWQTIGYDEPVNGPGEVEARAARWLANPPAEPFFLSVGFVDTHRDFPEPARDCPETDPRYTRPPEPLPDTPQTRYDMAGFNKMARRLDGRMGRVLDALDEAGLAENTLVICTTDHGIAFPRMKCNLHDSGIGVMLMMRGPGIPRGGCIDAMVSHVDVFPTLCGYLGIGQPDWLQGVSLMPLIRGEAEQVREEVFAEVNYHAAYEPMRAVRTTRWKYIRRYDRRSGPVLSNCDESISKDFWFRHGWGEREPAEEALYDLVFDPHEAHNLLGEPQYADVAEEMRERLQRWMAETEDPLLQGKVPAPEGARVNNADDFSPQQPVRDVSPAERGE